MIIMITNEFLPPDFCFVGVVDVVFVVTVVVVVGVVVAVGVVGTGITALTP
jgi:hypothetical protein